MIHYHGGPITPLSVAIAVWTRRHAFVSFHRPEQIAIAAEACQSFAIDNGAYSHWQQGHGVIDVRAYAEFVNTWARHPAFDWCLIPDVVDGNEQANDDMIEEWQIVANLRGESNVPVWHLHESITRLERLCYDWPRVALGSSGQFAKIFTDAWKQRMGEAMDAICDERGRPPCKLHGLRMLNNTVTSHLPLSSADSTNVAQNHNREYQLTDGSHAVFMASRLEHHATAARWGHTFGNQHNMELVG